MRTSIMIAGFLVVLAGCANQHVYVKDGADVVKHDSDLTECRARMSAYGSRDEAQDVMDKCMAEKGYDKRVSRYGY